jgi:hypothetical protein
MYSRKLIIMVLLLLFIFFLFFSDKMMPLPILITGFIILVAFFLLLNHYSTSWASYSPKLFYRKLFLYSLFFRLIFVGYHYLLTDTLQPGSFPFEINATDSWTYHLAAIEIRDDLFSKNMFNTLNEILREKSDWGFTIYTGIIYRVFGNYPLFVRLMNCLLGSLTVIMLSKIAGNLRSFQHARLTGIIAMLMPPLLWFGGMSLKETLMIFMVVAVLHYGVDYVTNRKLKLTGTIIMILFTFFLLYFRTVLAILLFICIGAYFFINTSNRKNFSVIILFATFIFTTWFLIRTFGFLGSIEGTYGQSENFFTTKMTEKTQMVGNINYKLTAVSPFIIASSVVTPFPSFLYLEERQLSIVIHYQNELIRNFMYYFAFLGLFYLFKAGFKKNSLIIMFSVGYLFIMAYTGYSFEDRFQLVVLPAMIICMSSGLIDSKPVWQRRWNFYLIAIIIAIFAWNLFKLSIRGL